MKWWRNEQQGRTAGGIYEGEEGQKQHRQKNGRHSFISSIAGDGWARSSFPAAPRLN